MRWIIEVALLLGLLGSGECIQVTLSELTRSTMLFSTVTLRCDYSTSAQLQNVLVTWKFKSFCKDPVLDYYSVAYQSSLQMGVDPANDCVDSKRTVRTVAQKLGSGEAILGPEYRDRKIYIQNKADLVIQEVMWWDNGMYFCSVDAPGDTVGDSDQEMKLIVYHWLTVLLILLGFFMLVLLLCICCCQCCPQKCCCYVRCPCCPQTCCCPEKAIMQHRLMKEAQKAMTPWLNPQPLYAPMSNHSSSYQMNPLLYAGSASGKGPMTPVPLPPPQHPLSMAPPPSVHGPNHVLDYLENQMRGMDPTIPLLGPQFGPHPTQHLHPQQLSAPLGPPRVPFTPGPPSMLSALDDAPINRQPGPNSGGSWAYRAQQRGPQVSMQRSYSQEDVLDSQSRSGGYGPPRSRSRSRDDLMDEPHRGPSRPQNQLYQSSGRRGSWSSDQPPSYSNGYTEYEPGRKPKRPERFSDKSSRSGTSIVI